MCTVIYTWLLLLNIVLKLALESAATSKVEQNMTMDYIDFSTFLVATDALMMMDCFMYFMYVIVMMGVILAWLPEIFGSLLDLFGRYVSWNVGLLFAGSVILLIVSSFVRMWLMGPILFGMHNLQYALTRNLMQFTSGFFLESGVSTFGITESLESAEEAGIGLPLLLNQVWMNFVFQFTIFNIFVALTLMYLRDSREAFKLRSEALLKQ